MPRGTELEVLARRIAWLERFRRPLALLIAIALSAFAIYRMNEGLPPDWPRAHMIMIGACVGLVVWYGIEFALGCVIALWETDYHMRTKPGLPLARIVRRK